MGEHYGAGRVILGHIGKVIDMTWFSGWEDRNTQLFAVDLDWNSNFGVDLTSRTGWVASCCLKGLGVFLADLPTSHTQEKKRKTMLLGVGFFNPRNSIFWVFYKKFDWIILKIWSLVLFTKSVRETNGRLKERSVNWRGRWRVPLDDTMYWC